MTTNAAVTPERIMQFAWGYIPTFVLEAAIRHRVFDVLDAGPKTLKETAAATGASERGLRAIMNALVGLNFLAKTDGRYTLTPESSAFLVSTKPGFQGGVLKHTSQQLVPKWLHLNEIVSAGGPPASVSQEGAGSEFFQNFVVDIFPMSYPAAQVLAKHLALDKTGTPVRVLDVAAGSGVWGIALAQSSERVKVTAVDWVDVLPATRKTVGRFGLTDGLRLSLEICPRRILAADIMSPRSATFCTARERQKAGGCCAKSTRRWHRAGRLPSPNFW